MSAKLIIDLVESLKWPTIALIALIAVCALRGVFKQLIDVIDSAVKHIVALLNRALCLLEQILPNVRVRCGNTEIDLWGSVPKELQSSTDDASDPTPGD